MADASGDIISGADDEDDVRRGKGSEAIVDQPRILVSL